MCDVELFSWILQTPSRLPFPSPRVETVYSKNEGYTPGATSAFALELAPPQDLPDALRGEQWAFVQLPAGQLQKESEDVRRGLAFGDVFNLAENVKGIKPDTLIPGELY